MLTVGWFYFSGDLYAANWNVHNLPFGEAATNAITMTLWSFLGLESACANADAVDNPEKSVPASVLCATALYAVIYIASTNVLFGLLPAADIEQSSASFGLAFAHMFGPLAGRVIMGMMTIACGGCLMVGSLPFLIFSNPWPVKDSCHPPSPILIGSVRRQRAC